MSPSDSVIMRKIFTPLDAVEMKIVSGQRAASIYACRD